MRYEKAFFETPLNREIAQIDMQVHLPDKSNILSFRQLLE
jgi:hypothetical protein